ACADRSRAKSATVPAAAATTATMLLAATRRLFPDRDSGTGGLRCAAALGRELLVELVGAGRRLAQERVDGRNEEERHERRHHKPPDDRAAERSILLAPLAERQRHWNHAEQHRQGRHQDWPQPRLARLDGPLDDSQAPM